MSKVTLIFIPKRMTVKYRPKRLTANASLTGTEFNGY